MRAIITVREVLDTVIEEVAFKTGILLTDYDIYTILKADPNMAQWSTIFHKKYADIIGGFRPEFIEDAVRVIRSALGELPDASHANFYSIKIFKEMQKNGIDPSPAFKVLNEGLASGKYKALDAAAIEDISTQSGIPKDTVGQLFLILHEHLNRGLSTIYKVESIDWDGVIPLSQLFKGELIPNNLDKYLDQRFLDYLAANDQQIDKMHWRNFERLCAELFKRQEYDVELGPGTKDGGIDVRIWTDAESRSGPPLIIIQCKRFKKENEVGIEWIKALWADVQFENADLGLLITTSYVEPGGKKVCQIRKWNLEAIEHDKVKKWVYSMWRHSWKKKGVTRGVGAYTLPPVVFFGKEGNKK